MLITWRTVVDAHMTKESGRLRYTDTAYEMSITRRDIVFDWFNVYLWIGRGGVLRVASVSFAYCRTVEGTVRMNRIGLPHASLDLEIC